MASRLKRALNALTGPSGGLAWWCPQAFHAVPAIPADAPIVDEPAVGGDTSSADLRERRREVAFDMYAEALVRMVDADAATHRRRRRTSA